jgi:NAD kinase
MKRIFLFLSLIALICSFQDMSAQSLRQRLKQKIIKDNLEAQAERDSIKAVEEGREPDPSPNTSMNHVYLDALGLTENVDYETNYSFDAYVQMEISNYKKNGNLDDQMLYDNYVNKTKADYAMVFKDGGDQSTIIFDTKNSAMLILTESDGEKTGFATSVDPEAMADMVEEYAEEDTEEADLSLYNMKKTGKTKNILGYLCEEYLVEDEENEVRMWVSEKLGKELRKDWMRNQQTFGAMFMHAYALNGMVLEYDLLDKDNGKKTIMLVTEIDMNHSHSVNTGSYAIMSMKQKSQDD